MTRGFSAVEILIVLAIFALLLASSMLALRTLQGEPDLQAEARALQQALELARNKTLASEGDAGGAQYGVYATSTNPHRFILFQGSDFASRDPNEDEVHELRDSIEFDAASFSFGGADGNEVVFDRVQGTTSQSGSAVVRVKAEPTNTKTVYVESSGIVTIDSNAAPTDTVCSPSGARECDTRHVHFDYSPPDPIDIEDVMDPSDTLTLNFDSGVEVVNIDFADFISGGQFVWSGEIEVPSSGGEVQTLEIRTHRLNNPDTQFSIHRAGPLVHTKPLLITISGDTTGNPNGKLIEYDANGDLVNELDNSIYVTATAVQ